MSLIETSPMTATAEPSQTERGLEKLLVKLKEILAPLRARLEALLAVHYFAAVGTMSAAFDDMKRRGWGRIINTVSEVAFDARMPGSLGYGAAKAAVWSATISASRAGASFGITVNAISPGARTRMNAEMLDAGTLGSAHAADLSPQHVANVVAYLASDAAGDITGRVVHAAGGAIREYSTTRSGTTELVARLSAVIATTPDPSVARAHARR